MNRLLSTSQKQELLGIARHSIKAALSNEAEGSIGGPHPGLNFEAATFVTLTKNKQLRGCIGTLEAHQPLLEDVRHNARAAAFNDPRFLPVEVDELKDLRVEISLLSEPSLIEFDTEESLFNQLHPEIDGVIIESGHHRATFLPQVWSQLDSPSEFFAHLKRKAGLPADFDVRELTVYRYAVEHFEEQS